MATDPDISLTCVCKRSLTSDGKCPTCSLKPDNCICEYEEDARSSDNASDLQAMAGGEGEMGGRPHH